MVLPDSEKTCDICGDKFKNSVMLDQHKKTSHKVQKHQVSKSSRYKATAIAAAIAVGVIAAVYFSDMPSAPAGVVEGVKCEPAEGSVFHIHAHLDLFVDSKSVGIPAGIGIKPNECLYWLHTHNTSGVIHIESPEQKTFTLGQFIQVWDNTPGIGSTFEGITHGDKNIRVFVNGNEVKGNFSEVVLSAHDEIVLVSGDVPQNVPASYDFGGL